MAGAVHESVLELIREHPFLLKTLLEEQGLELRFDELQLPAESDLGQLQPTQHRADLVFVSPGKQAVIVEVQNRRDDQKQFTWPLYTASLHEREACETLLIVIATKAFGCQMGPPNNPKLSAANGLSAVCDWPRIHSQAQFSRRSRAIACARSLLSHGSRARRTRH